MPLSPALTELFEDDLTQQLFKVIAEHKIVQSKTLWAAVSDKANITGDDAKIRVKWLKQKGLIEEYSASIDDFNTYYVTAGGIAADRQLRRATTPSAKLSALSRLCSFLK
jgi:hypothetical protein